MTSRHVVCSIPDCPQCAPLDAPVDSTRNDGEQLAIALAAFGKAIVDELAEDRRFVLGFLLGGSFTALVLIFVRLVGGGAP